MKKLLALLTLVFSTACATGGGWTPRPPRPPVPAKAVLQLYTQEGATAYNDAQPLQFPETWVGRDDQAPANLGGGAAWALTRADFNICARKLGYLTKCAPVPGPLHDLTVTIELEKDPTPILPPKVSGDALLRVYANFCNLPTDTTKPQFTPFYISLDKATRAKWLQDQKAAGSTHFVLSPVIDYPGAPWPWRDLYGDPTAFVDLVQEVIETPSASGYGFVPILFLDNGARDPRPRIAQTWPGIIGELEKRDLLRYVIVVPGWELVKASDWTSADLSYGLNLLDSLGVPYIGLHLSSGRWAGSSNPVEPDDPWQGAESGFWSMPGLGGDKVKIFFYETAAITERDDPPFCDPALDACWRNRLEDGIYRLGAGNNGWRKVPTVVFETVAYALWHGLWTSTAYARQVADGALQICNKYNVFCGFGNGLPTGAH